LSAVSAGGASEHSGDFVDERFEAASLPWAGVTDCQGFFRVPAFTGEEQGGVFAGACCVGDHWSASAMLRKRTGWHERQSPLLSVL